MDKKLKEMTDIMREKDKASKQLPPLDPEGVRLTEHKRFSFDIVETPVDPLR